MKKLIFAALMVFFVTALLLIVSSCSKGDEISLKFNKGDRHSYEVTVNQEISQSTEGKNFSITQGFTMLYNFNVLSAAENSAEIGFDFKFTDFHVKNNVVPINLPENLSEIINSAFIFEKNKPIIRLTVDNKGRVENISGYNDYINRVMAKAKEKKLSERVISLLTALTEQKTVTDNFTTLFDYLTDKPLKKSTTWRIKKPLQEGVPLSTDSIWKVLDVNEERILINKTSKITSEEAADKNENMDSGNTSGTESIMYKISKINGWPEEITSDLSLKYVIPMQTGAQSNKSENQNSQESAEMTIKNVTKIKKR